MERYFSPPAVTLPEARGVLVLAPHADDEVFGCGGTLARLAEQGATVRVVVLTRSREPTLASQRQAESRKAAERLGYPAPDFLDWHDGDLPAADGLDEALRGLLAEHEPDLVLAPSPWEMHRDHRATCEAAIRTCGELKAPLRLAFYEVGQPLSPDTLVDISAWQTTKAQAMACFTSQQARQDYLRHIQALNVYRTYTLPREVQAAEALLVVPAEQIDTFARRLEPERLSAVVWQAEREVAAFRAEQIRLQQNIESIQADARQLAEEGQALRAEQARLQRDIESVQADAQQLFQENQNLLNSLSWRVTRPLRVIARGLREPSRISRRLAYLMPARLRHRLLPLYRRFRHALYYRLQQHLTSLAISRSQAACRQAMLNRRLAELDRLPASGWGSAHLAEAEALPRVTVSVVTYNSADWLPALMESLVQQHYPLDQLDLVFVDNGSGDETRDVIEGFQQRLGARFADISLHRLPNPGFGAAHNHAIRQGQGDFLLVTNPDLEFAPDAIGRVVAMAMADQADVASWELRQTPYEHPKHYDPVSWETLWSSHACLLIRRHAFEALGGYDERIFLYGEDVEFSFRCREAGYRLRYCPLARVAHHTYEQAHQVKPAQYLGSTRANLYLRLRYGSRRDITAGALLALATLLRSPFPRARRRLLREYAGLLRQAPALLRENRAHPNRQVGVFRGLDYDMTRRGAFVPAPSLSDSPDLPLVSVITRTYQGRDWLLRQAGLSVLQQSWPNLEWIVVEDGGETCRATVETLASEATCPVRFASQEKHGRSAAGNLGLGLARGRWCLFLDDDDLLYADHLETLAGTLLNNKRLAGAYSLAWDVNSTLDPERHHIEEHAYLQHAGHVQEFDLSELAWRNYIPIQAILFERRLYLEHGGFREHFDQLEDWNLWRRYAQDEEFKLVPKTTSLYRTPSEMETTAARQALLDDAYRRVKEETDAELGGRKPSGQEARA
jgi:LmbE family N-acetylglucosaminyl deacetylase/GT2 family glycosyltransferase